MPTPRAASRSLSHAVLVSTRSPSSISVPMVTISALFRLFCPSCMLLFYNALKMENRAKSSTLLQAADNLARSRLSGKRYAHTLRVADTAERLARAHHLDRDRTR